jgi:hypothetical protein
MARIVDKDTRLIDVDFGPFTVAINRQATQSEPQGVVGSIATIDGPGSSDLLHFRDAGLRASSCVFYRKVDLSYMTLNNEVMQPVEVSIQRSSSTPWGDHQNGNNYSTIQEFLFVLSRPLNNEALSNLSVDGITRFNEIGLDYSKAYFGGSSGGGVTQAQNIYAEKRTYGWDSTTGATQQNGEILSDPPSPLLISQFKEARLLDVNTWGSLSTITGPELHCYRVVNMQPQSFDAGGLTFASVDYEGFTFLNFPPVNATFLCKDPNFTESEYLTRLVNAMNNMQEGDLVND